MLVGCSPSPVSSPPGRGDDLARFWVQQIFTTSATVDGVRVDVNEAESNQIRVNQTTFLKIRADSRRLLQSKG